MRSTTRSVCNPFASSNPSPICYSSKLFPYCAKFVDLDTELLADVQHQIRQRCFLRHLDMAVSFDLAREIAAEQGRRIDAGVLLLSLMPLP